MLVKRQQMARTLAAQQPAIFLELFQHIAVTDLGTHKLHAALLERQLHRQIGHQGADSAGHRFTPGQTLAHHQEQNFIAIEQAALRVDQLQPVGIAIQRHTIVSPIRFHRLNQGLRMGSSHAVIDVQAIRCAADADDIRAQLMKDLGCNVVRRAMRCIDHDL